MAYIPALLDYYVSAAMLGQIFADASIKGFNVIPDVCSFVLSSATELPIFVSQAGKQILIGFYFLWHCPFTAIFFLVNTFALDLMLASL